MLLAAVGLTALGLYAKVLLSASDVEERPVPLQPGRCRSTTIVFAGIVPISGQRGGRSKLKFL